MIDLISFSPPWKMGVGAESSNPLILGNQPPSWGFPKPPQYKVWCGFKAHVVSNKSHLYYSYHLGNSKSFRNFVPKKRWRPKYIYITECQRGSLWPRKREGVISQAQDLGHLGLISLFTELSSLRTQNKQTKKIANRFKIWRLENYSKQSTYSNK